MSVVWEVKAFNCIVKTLVYVMVAHFNTTSEPVLVATANCSDNLEIKVNINGANLVGFLVKNRSNPVTPDCNCTVHVPKTSLDTEQQLQDFAKKKILPMDVMLGVDSLCSEHGGVSSNASIDEYYVSTNSNVSTTLLRATCEPPRQVNYNLPEDNPYYQERKINVTERMVIYYQSQMPARAYPNEKKYEGNVGDMGFARDVNNRDFPCNTVCLCELIASFDEWKLDGKEKTRCDEELEVSHAKYCVDHGFNMGCCKISDSGVARPYCSFILRKTDRDQIIEKKPNNVRECSCSNGLTLTLKNLTDMKFKDESNGHKILPSPSEYLTGSEPRAFEVLECTMENRVYITVESGRSSSNYLKISNPGCKDRMEIDFTDKPVDYQVLRVLIPENIPIELLTRPVDTKCTASDEILPTLDPEEKLKYCKDVPLRARDIAGDHL